MATRVAAVPVEQVDDVALAEIERIYVESFPPEERGDLRHLLASERRLVVASEDSMVIGFGLWVAVNDQSWLLEYMAVDAKRRSDGIGRALLGEWTAIARADGRVRILLLEIEDPDIAGAFPEAVRRERFYERWGASRVPCLRAYFIPSFVDGEPIPMRLLYRSLFGDPPAGDDLRRTLADLYASEYPGAEKLLQRVLQEVVC